MDLYKMTAEEYHLLDLPASLLSLDEMSETAQKKYLELYALYAKFLAETLARKVPIADYDAQFMDHAPLIVPVEYSDQDIYQRLSCGVSRFFYIRNNLYLYRLDKDETGFLNRRLQSGNLTLDQEMEDFILQTFRRVTYVQIYPPSALIPYGPLNRGFLAPNNALVIGFRCVDPKTLDENLGSIEVREKIFPAVKKDLINAFQCSIGLKVYHHNSANLLCNQDSLRQRRFPPMKLPSP